MALLVGLSGCGAKPPAEGKIIAVTFETVAPAPLNSELGIRDDDDGIIRIEFQLSSTAMFRKFGKYHIAADERFCDEGNPGHVLLRGPMFGLDMQALADDESGSAEFRSHALTDDERASVFLIVHDWPRIDYFVDRDDGFGGIISDQFDYDGIKQPRDICFELFSANFFARGPNRTKMIALPGEAIRKALLTRNN